MEMPDYKYTFKTGIYVLENVNKYLGVTFSKLNNFKTTKAQLKQQATKALYFVLVKSKDKSLN